MITQYKKGDNIYNGSYIITDTNTTILNPTEKILIENGYVKEVIEEVDNEAFILITDAQEVIGKGFTTPVVPTPIENLVKECKDNAHYIEHKD